MASVDDFLRALDSIEAEMREVPDVVFVEMSLTRGRISGDVEETFDKKGRYIMLLTSRSIHAHWDSLCFDIGGPEFPFVWSPKRSAVYESFPKDLVNAPESVEFAVWYYLDSWRSSIPQHLLDMLDPRDEIDRSSGLAAMAYQAEIDRVFNVMRSVKTAWSLAPETVIREFGDLSKMPMGPTAVGNDCFYLWWPSALLTLAIREADVVLSASASSHTPDSFWDSLDLAATDPAEVSEAHDAFEPTTWTVSLRPPSLLAATSCALRAFRRVAEDSMKKPATVTAGADQPAAADTPAAGGDATETLTPGGAQSLGITLGDREASRIVNGKRLTTKFGGKGKPWELFRELFHAGETGLARNEIMNRLWPNTAISDNTLDQHKATANGLLVTIRVEIKPDNRGVWRLAALNS